MMESKYIVFKAGNEEYAVDITQINRIAEPAEITKVPNSPDYVRGVMNLMGKIVVIVDIAKRLGFPPIIVDRNSRVIDVSIADSVVGMLVPSVSELISLDDSMVKKSPKLIEDRIRAEYYKGVVVIGERLIIMLDIKKIVAIEDIKKLETHNPEGFRII